jgi:polyisoprenoid-binding protein YceI
MSRLLSLVLFLTSVMPARAQLYSTSDGEVGFHSHTFLEDIDAVNKKVSAVIDPVKKNMAFSLLMKGFEFKRKLMQEHFNENYVESDKYPSSTFQGSFTGDLNTAKDGAYPVIVKGSLMIHGVTKPVEAPGTLTVRNGSIIGTATFKLNPADYKIDIPFIVREKIEKENTIQVNIEFKPKK